MKNYKNVFKIIIFVLVLLSPIFNYNYILILNNNIIKLLIILGIIGLCFYDFQIAILSTILFLIIVIQLNSHMIDHVKTNKVQIDNYIDFAELKDLNNLQFPPCDSIKSLSSSYSPLPYSVIPQQITTPNCQLNDFSNNQDEMNQDMFDMFVDEKIKPYDVFIKMFVNEETISKAQGEII